MLDMAQRFHLPAVIAAVSVLLAVIATLTLGDADAAVAAAVILGLVVIAGTAVGAGVASTHGRH